MTLKKVKAPAPPPPAPVELSPTPSPESEAWEQLAAQLDDTAQAAMGFSVELEWGSVAGAEVLLNDARRLARYAERLCERFRVARGDKPVSREESDQ